jgi:DNA-binding HxlR family transcriptional regulator
MRRYEGYDQFCPVSLATELVCTRWTPLIIRDLLGGSTRFNELQRGVPRMSPALLSKRLREIETAGLVRRVETKTGPEYRLTRAGRDLQPIVEALGRWGVRWIDPEISLDKLDAPLLMWMMSRGFDPTPRPPARCTIEFSYPELPRRSRKFWLIVDGDLIELCATEPGYEVDLYVSSDLRSMTAIWMGLATPQREIEAGRVDLTGSRKLMDLFPRWLGRSPMAANRKRLAA